MIESFFASPAQLKCNKQVVKLNGLRTQLLQYTQNTKQNNTQQIVKLFFHSVLQYFVQLETRTQQLNTLRFSIMCFD